jgi:hypothetical protein
MTSKGQMIGAVRGRACWKASGDAGAGLVLHGAVCGRGSLKLKHLLGGSAYIGSCTCALCQKHSSGSSMSVALS